jgi:replicative DNA helicase
MVVERIETLYNRDNPSDVTGIPTGYADLDRMTSGFQPGDLIVIAGRPSMGKTALALNIGENVALHAGLPVAVFSMEMGAAQLALRMIGSVGRLDQHKLRTGRLVAEDWEKLSEALGRLNEAPILIDETPALNAIEVRSRARRLMRQYGKLGLVIVDYLQLMQATTQGENRATEISEISRAMKSLAKELQVPVVALSQLNRSLEQRPNKRPVMSDLRECVTGDTLVVTTDGGRVPVRALIGTTPEVWALNDAQKLVAARSDCVWSVGVRPVTRVTFASGRSIRATARHRLLAGDGWRRVEQLEVGARVAIARADLFWDRIVAIHPDGEEEVFDLTVPGPSSWLADGIVSHNSGAIEQDSDVILFIYRDEVYNPESQDKGTAEIIIGKQRNGPIGTVRLTFLGEYTRFEGYASPGKF